MDFTKTTLLVEITCLFYTTTVEDDINDINYMFFVVLYIFYYAFLFQMLLKLNKN